MNISSPQAKQAPVNAPASTGRGSRAERERAQIEAQAKERAKTEQDLKAAQAGAAQCTQASGQAASTICGALGAIVSFVPGGAAAGAAISQGGAMIGAAANGVAAFQTGNVAGGVQAVGGLVQAGVGMAGKPEGEAAPADKQADAPKRAPSLKVGDTRGSNTDGLLANVK